MAPKKSPISKPSSIDERKSEYEKLSKTALKQICRDKKIKGFSGWSKDELIRKCALEEKTEAYMEVIKLSTYLAPSMNTFKTLSSYVAKDPVSYVKFSSHYMYEWGWLLYIQKSLPDASFCFPEFGAPGGDLEHHYRGGESAISYTNTGGVKIQKWGLKSILKCLENKRLAIVVLNLKGRGGQHANAIIFDKKYKTITRFEPHGSESNLRMIDNNVLDRSFDKWLLKNQKLFDGWEYNPPLHWCPKKGPQAIESELKSKKKGEISGYCEAWALMFLHLRILNPDHSNEQIVEYMLGKKNPSEMKQMIRDYAGFIAEHANPYVKKRRDEVFAPETYVRLTHSRVSAYGKILKPGNYKLHDNTYGGKYKDQPIVFIVGYPVRSGFYNNYVNGAFKWWWELMVPVNPNEETKKKIDDAYEMWVKTQ